MNNYFIIDAHVHTYKTAEIGLQAQAGGGSARCSGTPEELLAIMRNAGISKAVQVNMTPARSMFDAALARLPSEPKEYELQSIREKITNRVKRRNEWTCQMAQENPELVPFPSVDPISGQEAMVDEIQDKVKNFAAKGVKLHPAEGHFSPDDPMDTIHTSSP